MVSYIIIGCNEGWKLTKCLLSVFDCIRNNQHVKSEVIYIDSNSKDDSVERAKALNVENILIIQSKSNAAIARNVGADNSKGDILYFIDGDMEIEKDFLSKAVDKDNNLVHDCVTGHVDDYLYDINNNFLGIKQRSYKDKLPTEKINIKTNGGIFLIKRDTWHSVGGMRNKYKKGQDLDLSVRLSKKGYKTYLLPFLITKHHTIEYNNDERMWYDLKNGNFLYPPMLFRDHFSSKAVWIRTLRHFYTSFTLALSLLLIIFTTHNLWGLGLIFYCFLLFSRVTKNTIDVVINGNKFVYFFKRVIYQLLSDTLFWFGFLFYFPNRNSKPVRITRI